MSTSSSSSSSWEPPLPEDLQRMLPQYEITGILGRGGMGAVYQARQSKLNRNVAIKVLPETFTQGNDELNFVKRFEQEAQAMANLDHPAIISVYDFGETAEGQLYFVMEFVDGMDIQQYLRHHGGRLPQEHALSITAHVLDALEYAHSRGIVHRDIKPANVLLNREGRVKIADFGLAKKFGAAADETAPGLTMTNVAVGTPDFVAPEALDSDQTPDHRADLYAVGVMLYQMLTGKLPRGNFKLPSELNSEIDPRLDEIVGKAMETDPDDRYANALSVRVDLDLILSQPMAKVQAGEESSVVAAVVPVTTTVKGIHKSVSPDPSSNSHGNQRHRGFSWRSLWIPIGSGAAAAAILGIYLSRPSSDPEPQILRERPADSSLQLVGEAKETAAPETGAVRTPSSPNRAPSTTKPVAEPLKTPAQLSQKPEQVRASPAVPTVVPVPPPVVVSAPVVSKPEPVSQAPLPESPKPVDLASIPALQTRLEGYLNARRTGYGDLASKYSRGLDSRLNQAADAADLTLATAFNHEKSNLDAFQKKIDETESDMSVAVKVRLRLPVLPEGTPESLVTLRRTWEGEVEKIQSDLDGKLLLSLQSLEAELTRARAFDQAGAVLAFRETLGIGTGVESPPAKTAASAASVPPPEGGSTALSIFDGKTLEGWKAVPNASPFTVVDGAIRVEGKGGVLYFDPQGSNAADITDFELTITCKTENEANSGVFFHCVEKADGSGYLDAIELQIANENKDPLKTGSVWGVGDSKAEVSRMPAKDGEWFEYRMIVSGKTVSTYVDGKKLVQWTHPDNWTHPKKPDARMGKGTFGFQANGGLVWIKDVYLKRANGSK